METQDYYNQYKKYKAKLKKLRLKQMAGSDSDTDGNKRFPVGNVVAVVRNNMEPQRGRVIEDSEGVCYIDLGDDNPIKVANDGEGLRFVKIPAYYQY